MEMTGEQLIPIPQAEVWRGLNDPEILKTCITGCESIERVSDAEYRVALTASVGPVKAKFTGKLRMTDLNPPDSYSLVFEGSGGAAGFAKGGAKVSLSAQGSATRLVYSAKASVGGKLAQIGSRLSDSVAMNMADEFFDKFNQTMAPAAPAAAESPATTGAASEPAPGASFNPIWIVAATILALLLVSYLLGAPKYI